MSGIMKEGNPLSKFEKVLIKSDKIHLHFNSFFSKVTHIGMFVPVFENLGTSEQQAEWQSRARNCEIIGTYAQTELGHGTFVRGLETTSTYDQKTKEFVIHSPTITAYKVNN